MHKEIPSAFENETIWLQWLCFAVALNIHRYIKFHPRFSLPFTLTVPPSQPVITGYTEGTIIAAGSVQRLQCTSSGGNPLATLTWYKNDKKVSRKGVQVGGPNHAYLLSTENGLFCLGGRGEVDNMLPTFEAVNATILPNSIHVLFFVLVYEVCSPCVCVVAFVHVGMCCVNIVYIIHHQDTGPGVCLYVCVPVCLVFRNTNRNKTPTAMDGKRFGRCVVCVCGGRWQVAIGQTV